MIEKFTEDRFNLHYYFKVIEHVHCMNSSKSCDVDGEGIWIQRLSIHKQDKKAFICDKFLPHFIWQLYKPTLKGDLNLLKV